MTLLRADPPPLIYAYLTETRWLRLASFTALYFAQGVPKGLFTAIAFAVSLFATVQDVAVDGMATDVLP